MCYTLPKPAAAPKSAPASAIDDVTHLTSLERLFRTAFDTVVQEDGWATLASMGSAPRKLDPAFDPRTYGHTQLLQLVKAYPKLIEVNEDASKGGSVHYVRMKSKNKKAAQPPARMSV